MRASSAGAAPPAETDARARRRTAGAPPGARGAARAGNNAPPAETHGKGDGRARLTMSGPFSPSETRYEDNKATWLPEVGFASAANGREKDESCVLYERVSVPCDEDEGDRYVAIEDLLLSSFPKGEHREVRLRAWYASPKAMRPKHESSSRS